MILHAYVDVYVLCVCIVGHGHGYTTHPMWSSGHKKRIKLEAWRPGYSRDVKEYIKDAKNLKK